MEERNNTASAQVAEENYENGAWQREAVDDRERMDDLNNKREEFTQKRGLSRVKQELLQLWDYLADVMRGHYTDYSAWALTKVVACLLYVVSPFDLVPDFFPWVGWLDDIAVVIYVFDLLHEELEAYDEWRRFLLGEV